LFDIVFAAPEAVLASALPVEKAMEINQTPFYDPSDNRTGCCAFFHHDGWDGVDLHFRDKLFLRAITHSLSYVPRNMGKVFSSVQQSIREAGAAVPEKTFVMSRDLSAFTGEHLFAVDRPVPGREMVRISGDFVTRLFEGPYSALIGWYDQLELVARGRGAEPGRIYFFYTTCPKCQKAYGQNPVVGMVELLPAHMKPAHRR